MNGEPSPRAWAAATAKRRWASRLPTVDPPIVVVVPGQARRPAGVEWGKEDPEMLERWRRFKRKAGL